MRDSTVRMRFCAAYFFMFMSVGVMSHYGSVFFASEGYTTFQVGQLAAAGGFGILLVQPLMGLLSDRFGAVKVLSLLCMALCLPTIAGVYLGRGSYLLLMVAYVAQMVVMRTAGPLLDSWISALGLEGLKINYNVIRAMGSLGIAACGLVVGFLLSRWGFASAFVMQAACLLVSMALLAGIPSTGRRGAQSGRAAQKDHAQGRAQVIGPSPLKSPVYWGVVLSIALVCLGHNADATYISLLYMSLGGSEAGVGSLIFVQTASEVVMMVLYTRLRRRFSSSVLLQTSMLMYVLRFSLVYAAQAQGLVLALQVVQGFSFGLLTPALVEVLTRLAGVGHTATAITVCTTLQFGLGSMLGNLLAGWVSELAGLRAVYALAVGVCLAGALLYFATTRLEAARGGRHLRFANAAPEE